MWLLFLSDDLLAISASKRIRQSVILVVVVYVVFGHSRELEEGQRTSCPWVGLEVNMKEARFGITSKRAMRLDGRHSRLLEERVLKMQSFQGALSRAAFVCGALEYDRPFLAPLYGGSSEALVSVRTGSYSVS